MLATLQAINVPLFMRNCDIASQLDATPVEGVDYLYDGETQKSDYTQYMGMTGFSTRDNNGNEDFSKTDNSWISPEPGPQ